MYQSNREEVNHLSEAAAEFVYDHPQRGEVVQFPPQGGSAVVPPPPQVIELREMTPEEIAARRLKTLRIIEDSLGLADFDATIEQLLGHIHTKAEHVLLLRRTAEEAQTELDQIEKEILRLVEAEPDPANPGKRRFSNAEARAAEVARRKAVDAGYQAALRRARDAQNARDTAQLDLDDLERRLAALRGARSYAESRLRLLASL